MVDQPSTRCVEGRWSVFAWRAPVDGAKLNAGFDGRKTRFFGLVFNTFALGVIRSTRKWNDYSRQGDEP